MRSSSGALEIEVVLHFANKLRLSSMSYDAYDIEIWHKSNWSILVSKLPSAPQQSHLFIRFCPKKCLKIKKLKNTSTKNRFINFENPLHFRPNLKSTFTYQNGLESKKMFGEMFLKLNFTSKYIWGIIPGAKFHFHKNLNVP